MSQTTANSSTLVVFCRRPAAGVGKQRIAAELGSDTAETLANYLLATVLEDAAAWSGPVILAPAREEDLVWASGLLARPHRVVAQREGNLGERLNSVDKEIRCDTDAALLYVGSDAPVLDQPYFSQARKLLQDADVVLGPAEDGGVTLMGSNVAWPELSQLPWSTENLGAELERLCLEHGLSVIHLPLMYDVDLACDLPRLQTDLEADSRPARQKLHQWLGSR